MTAATLKMSYQEHFPANTHSHARPNFSMQGSASVDKSHALNRMIFGETQFVAPGVVAADNQR